MELATVGPTLCPGPDGNSEEEAQKVPYGSAEEELQWTGALPTNKPREVSAARTTSGRVRVTATGTVPPDQEAGAVWIQYGQGQAKNSLDWILQFCSENASVHCQYKELLLLLKGSLHPVV
ncbi:UNVERIFIED_CONTAM: hypothetical protein K2H54_037973 [Gekko kuhli]